MAPASNNNDDGTNECLEQLFHKLLAVSESDQPYLFLVQHTLSFQTRQTATTTRKDETVYRRAGLRTPGENGKRDFAAGALWLQYIVGELKKESSDILWVQTSSRRLPVWLQTATTSARSSKIKVMDVAAVDAFGWDDDNVNETTKESSSSTSLMNDLDHLATCIENHVKETVDARKQQSPEPEPASSSTTATTSAKRIPIVVESLTPLFMRHGLQRTIRFLERISKTAACPLVVAVRTETLLAVQHQVLEDLAQATLCLLAGEAVLLRQGVREKGNMVRENLPYRMTSEDGSSGSSSSSGLTRLQVVSLDDDSQLVGAGLETDLEPAVPEAPAALQALSLAANANTTAANPTATATNRPKVKMELQDDDGPRKVTLAESSPATEKASTAHIYIQEDDAEFQDYDEEDPDDDLDI
jgi:hypothetical protein